MTHTKQRGSNQHWDRSPPWPHGAAMGGDQPERSLRFGRTKKISEVVRRRKTMKDKGSNHTQKLDCNKKWDRKLYPLRGRVGDGLSCHVLLTRLEESIRGQKKAEERKVSDKARKGGISVRTEAKLTSKLKSKLRDFVHVSQPRKRRLASLNAEAVNSLLLERATDQPAVKQAKRQEEPTNGALSMEEFPTSRSTTTAALKVSRGSVAKPSSSHKPDQCRISVKVKRKTSRGGESRGLSLDILDTPTPRRLAGLNAAALLKLTSSSAVTKQRVKAPPSATITSDCKNPAATQKQPPRVKHKERSPKQKRSPMKVSPMHCSCSACKEKADFEPKVEWESGTVAKPGYQPRSMLGYSLKNVKEEQLETELSPCYCCPPEGSVEYCHRLAFFLGQQPYAESGDQPISSAVTPVKRECLVTSPSLTHSHPALTLSHHPCLCYYVHITPHPPHTGTSAPPLPSRRLSFAPPGLCPNRTIASEPPGPPVTHTSGMPHPAYCNTVGSPCCGQACGINGYTCRALPPLNSRGCSFSAGCTGCSRGIKTETFSSPQGDHSPSLLVPPPISTQTNPHLLTPLSDRDQQPRARLKAAADHPRGTKASSNGTLPAGRLRSPQQLPPSPPSPCKQKKVVRRRATNGWRPVGTPAGKEVFIAGEDETALRLCYEGVERDGEVIRVRDTVLLRSGPRKKSLPYVAKISALWEDPKSGELMMSLFWYYRPEHTQGGRDPSTHCEVTLFITTTNLHPQRKP
ncbi:bromo adjacent homology domain-containing 1 protein-like isoform X2 [Dunckerocampus dactyliophorus]|uniref:bromo adjacent homology domain-containing 1 protein-like isoform X2 n=1 Tax=Dunckerocampus dactyliophorus TaxID=161453 RepID=UPI0024049E3E|nr:bromo adjacent homology domain-containing 1 protein-like isoform X2 [Dunckerocampus dactyliophorus]